MHKEYNKRRIAIAVRLLHNLFYFKKYNQQENVKKILKIKIACGRMDTVNNIEVRNLKIAICKYCF